MALKIEGFDKANDKVKHRLIMSINGLEKQGKTHFALTAPGPVAYLDFDMGSEGVLHKFTGDKDILVSTHDIPKDPSTDGGFNYDKAWKKFYNSFKKALEHPQVRSVVVDTGTEMWELLRMARFGKLTQVKPHHYGPVNAEMQELIRMAYELDKNLILIHKMKQQYVDDKFNGKYEAAGFKNTPFLVQINAETSFEDGVFTLRVVDCRHDMGLAGMELEGCDFPTLAQFVFPDSDPDTWR